MSYPEPIAYAQDPLAYENIVKWFRKNLQSARHLFLHKLYVFTEGRKLDVPLWRLLIHDWSKLRPVEWTAYREYFHGEKTPEARAAFDVAWLMHIHRNPHHWNFWVFSGDKNKALKMPDVFVREMIADWTSMSLVLKTRGPKLWYLENANKMILHPETRARVEELLGIVDPFKVPVRTRFLDNVISQRLEKRQRGL